MWGRRTLVWAWLVMLPLCARAERIAARHFDVADGLGHNTVTSIVQDSRGFVWVGTYEGASRFDGQKFRTFGIADGLPHPIVQSIVEDRYGHLWIVPFNGGVLRLIDDPQRRFQHVRVGATSASNTVLGMQAAADGSLWCVSEDGVYRGTPRADGSVVFAKELALGKLDGIPAALIDSRGTAWFGVGPDLLEFDGRGSRRWTSPELPGNGSVVSIVEDRDHAIIAARAETLLQRNVGNSGASWHAIRFPRSRGEQITALLVDRRGRLWVGTSQRLWMRDSSGSLQVMRISGLQSQVDRLYEDREGNIWIGTHAAGLFVLDSELVTTFTTADGLPGATVRRIVEGKSGRIFASTDGGVVEIVGGRARPVPGGDSPSAAVGNRLLFDGKDWWAGAEANVFRIPGPELRFDRAQPVLSGLMPVPGEWYGAVLLQGVDGSLWAAGPAQSIFRLRASASAAIQPQKVRISEVNVRAGRMVGDRGGDLWIGSHGGILRRRPDGRIDAIHAQPGLPETLPRSFLLDQRGWLWIGLRYHGVSVTRNPTAEHPSFHNYSTSDGLSSEAVWALCEGGAGEIFVGTGRGVDRLDPRNNTVRYFAAHEGLSGDIVNDCMRDSRGRVWISTMSGITRVDPAPAQSTTPPSVYFTALHLQGEAHRLGARGATVLAGYRMPTSGDFSLEFVAPSSGRSMRYEHMLENVDRSWSPPTPAQTIDFAHLGPGSYRLLVRAIDDRGQASSNSASFDFVVVPPFWRRWWFVTIAALAAAALVLLIHHLRLRRVLAVEGLRRQVALDLHDEIGSGLTEIAMMSEVARRGMAPPADALADTADLARSLRESMSDIVWAIDPRKDHLLDLVQRMRDACFHLLDRDRLDLEFHAPGERHLLDMVLPPDRKRHLLLIFKEAVANVARHAQASKVRIALAADSHQLRLTISDDGVGFDPVSVHAGHGLQNIRTRAVAIDAELSLVSHPGKGTHLELTVPLRVRSPHDRAVASGRTTG